MIDEKAERYFVFDTRIAEAADEVRRLDLRALLVAMTVVSEKEEREHVLGFILRGITEEVRERFIQGIEDLIKRELPPKET